MGKHEDEGLAANESVATTPPDFTRQDLAVIFTKGALGSIPIVGSMVAEIVGSLIPNQRIERLHRFVDVLSSRLADVEARSLEDRWRDPQTVDFTEDVLIQAARAKSEERIGYLASFLKNALTDEEMAAVDNATILNLLGQLNDVEIVLLRAQSSHRNLDQEFWETHRSTIAVEPSHSNSSPAEVDRATLHEVYKTHLIRLGLVQPTFINDKTKLPEFDTSTGTLKVRGYRSTRIGRALLQRIDFAPSGWT